MSYTIVANWKMNGNLDFFKSYFEAFSNFNFPTNTNVIVAPQAPLLSLDTHCHITLAAQNMSEHDSGAYTGELNADILKGFDIQHVILGHSERRQYFNETNAMIQAKAEQAIKNNITPIICIGESLKAYEAEETCKILEQQLSEAIPKTATAEQFLIAYEPLWAIGTGKTPSIEEIEKVHHFIATKTEKHGAVKILYGGSVKPNNATEILAQPHVNGVLVGGASLAPLDFQAIISAVK